MSIFLGVDGGGSKTAYLLLDDRGSTLAEYTGESTYYFDSRIGIVEPALAAGVETVLERAGLVADDVDRAFFGLPGYGEARKDLDFLNALPANILGHSRYDCDNDMVCGWAGSLGAEDGINVISGTGSMTYGQRNGQGCRVGGWGELFGDEGSAYWIAVRALNLFSRMSDGRLPIGPLHSIVSERLNLRDDLDIVSLWVNRDGGRRAEIAGLSRAVSDAAQEGDLNARALLMNAADELATLVHTTRERLGYDIDDVVPVSFSGGVFASPIVRNSFATALDARSATYDLREPLFRPVVGAALYAAKRSGTPLSPSSLAVLASGKAE
jgi:N-acetylglucosamine kinase-like BadF-type ATPase